MERYGASSHTYLLPILKQIKKIPLLFIVGGLDAKYLALSHLVKSSISQASVLSIPEAGHILPLEAPDAVAREILAWQKNIKEA